MHDISQRPQKETNAFLRPEYITAYAKSVLVPAIEIDHFLAQPGLVHLFLEV